MTSAYTGLWSLEPAMDYLNHGAFGATPVRVLRAQDRWRAQLEAQPVRFFERELGPALRAAADRVAGVLGARGDDLVFVSNATAAVNAVARSLGLAPGDRVVTTTHVYAAVRNVLRFVCDRAGAELVEVRVPFPIEGPEVVVAALRDSLRDGARLVVVDHITSMTGLVLPVAELVAVCREAGVPVLVDGAHAPGHVPVDLDALGADWWTGNAHKWLLAPKGCAVLHARGAEAQAIEPDVISHGFGQGFLTTFDWTGTRDPSAWLAVTEALDLIAEIGLDAMQAHNHALALQARDLLCTAWDSPPPAPTSMIGNLATVRAPGDHPATFEAARRLHDHLWDRFRIEVPVFPFAGALWVRISAQLYNHAAQYERLAAALAP